MIKLAAGAVLMLVCFYIGIYVERYYKGKAQFFKEFYEFLQYAAREINYLKTNIIKIADSYSQNKNTPFVKALKDAAASISEGREKKDEHVYLSEEEKGLLSGFFQKLSKSDYQEQGKLFQRYNAEIGEKVKVSEKQKKEKGELVKKLCILGGVGLLIIIV